MPSPSCDLKTEVEPTSEKFFLNAYTIDRVKKNTQWILLAQDTDHWRALVKMIINLR
jgi:hypothetical protein